MHRFRVDAPINRSQENDLEQSESYLRGVADAERMRARLIARGGHEDAPRNVIDAAQSRADAEARADYSNHAPSCALWARGSNASTGGARPTTIDEAQRRADEEARRAYAAGAPECALFSK